MQEANAIAVVPVGSIVRNSGSRSWATVTPWTSDNRTPAAFSAAFWPFHGAKLAVVTVRAATSTMLTEPSGLIRPVAWSASPSSAVSSFVPSGVNASMSGIAPTVTAGPFTRPVAASKNCTAPGAWPVAPSTATATRPFATATLLGTPDSGIDCTNVRPPDADSVNTSRARLAGLVTKHRLLPMS
jgi:hypothetical protein